MCVVFFAVEKIFEEPNFLLWKRLIIMVLVVKLIFLTVFILSKRFALPLRVRMKDSFGRLEESDGKVNDVLILYSSSDSAIAVGVLLPVLQNKYGYKCETIELSENVTLCKLPFHLNI